MNPRKIVSCLMVAIAVLCLGAGFGSRLNTYANASAQEQEKPSIGVMGRIGFVVLVADPGSPAAQIGMKSGDVITALNGRTVSTVEDVWGTIRESVEKQNQSVEVTFLRNDAQGQKMEEHKETVKAMPFGSWRSAK